jgi:NAD(P)-dependent dehydrogenase (short-subunit alcohol dehydrogenase family)
LKETATSRIFVTGSGQGIGAETVRQLLEHGHEVVAHARNQTRAEHIRTSHSGIAGVVIGDLADMVSTRDLAHQANDHGPYDAIIHNAGRGGGSGLRQLSVDGFELIFHTNIVGPYMLTCLMPLASRMVYLTSGLEADGVWNSDDLQWESRAWKGMQAYCDTKLHDSMLAFELASRHPEITVNAVDPGWIKTAMGGSGAPDPVSLGAETQVWLATSDHPIARATGQYLKRQKVLIPNPTTRDVAARGALMAELERITGLALP